MIRPTNQYLARGQNMEFPTPETMGNLGTNLTRKVLWDCLGGHARHLKWR